MQGRAQQIRRRPAVEPALPPAAERRLARLRGPLVDQPVEPGPQRRGPAAARAPRGDAPRPVWRSTSGSGGRGPTSKTLSLRRTDIGSADVWTTGPLSSTSRGLNGLVSRIPSVLATSNAFRVARRPRRARPDAEPVPGRVSPRPPPRALRLELRRPPRRLEPPRGDGPRRRRPPRRRPPARRPELLGARTAAAPAPLEPTGRPRPSVARHRPALRLRALPSRSGGCRGPPSRRSPSSATST